MPETRQTTSDIMELGILKSKRDRVFAKLQTIYDNMVTVNDNNVHEFEPQYKNLNRLETDFEELQDEIIEINQQLTEPSRALEVIQVQKAFDALLYKARGNYLKCHKSVPDASPGPSQVKRNSIRSDSATHNTVSSHLPKISIPKFSGNIQDWPAFYGLFDSAIHNNSDLQDAEKFYFLKSLVLGDALSIVSTFHLSAPNYPLAYQALKDRYQNKRRLANLYINQLSNFSPITSGNYSNFQKFLNVHSNAVNALKALRLPDLGDFVLFHLSLRNLDSQSRKLFEDKQPPNTVPSHADLINFVTDQSRACEVFVDEYDSKSSKKSSPNPSYASRQKSLLVANASTSNSNSPKLYSCPICKGPHNFAACSDFLKLSTDERYSTCKKFRRCFNCLGAHQFNECKSMSSCRTCNSKRHHSLLHRDPGTIPSDSQLNNSASTSQPVSLSCNLPSTVLLGTSLVYIRDNIGNHRTIRAVIDPGSQISAITESCVQSLGLRRQHISCDITGIANNSVPTRGVVQCILCPIRRSGIQIPVSATILPKIASDLPSMVVSPQVKERFRNLIMADNSFDVPGPVDFLIGADVYTDILEDGANLLKGLPSAICTIFGWVILGKVPSSGCSPSPTSLFVSTPGIDTQLRAFWETEELPHKPPSNPTDLECEAHFEQTHYREPDGRYVVSLPFSSSCPTVGENRDIALKCYHSLERRLDRDPQTSKAYSDFLQEYLAMGHMVPAKLPSSYVIPHHAVFKNGKIRVVFNASALDKQGSSLNKHLISGPKLQKSLSDILLRFRLHEVALCTDIKMMYRQILVNPSHRCYQHIFWRPPSSPSIQEFELTTVTYGLTPSAFLAQRVLQQIVSDEGQPFPMASKAIMEDTYMDDIVTGSSNPEETALLRHQLQSIMALGQFELRKWSSNHVQLLSDLPGEYLETPLAFNPDDGGVIKVLGLCWDPKTDQFSYVVNFFSDSISKRSILSYSARIFDPLGWLAPVIFWIKHFLQRLWISGVDWDSLPSAELQSSWLEFSKEMSRLTEVRISRPISPPESVHRIVGFCDASEKGFAAALYLQVTSSSSQISAHLLTSKTKVSPLNVLSIPRLELAGALLLAKLLRSSDTFVSSLNLKGIHLYTDSKTVLSWLNTPPYKLKTFVANRVVSILQLTSPDMWSHIPTDQNPADLPSRGLLPSQILDNSFWWHGPTFLRSPVEEWPKSPTSPTSPESLPELKPVVLQVQTTSSSSLYEHMSQFSTLTRLKRVFAWVLRFIHNLKNPQNRLNGPLMFSELQNSLVQCIRLSQHSHFSSDIKAVQQDRAVSQSLKPLAPFLDEDDLLRVGGRLRFSDLPRNSKHPVLLAKKCHLTTLLVDQAHLSLLHSGPRLVQAYIQQRFWILGARDLIRQRIRSCLVCHKFQAKPLQPYMADLPASRTQPSRPFNRTGIDFAGPVFVKESPRRNAKKYSAYICLFVCMATKAVHLELVSSLSTPAFLAAFDRFVSRRGLCAEIFTDCGTNFKGAARHFRELHEFLIKHESLISNHLIEKEIVWHFNPPCAPNFGGLWEAGIKSTKHLLSKFPPEPALTFEEFYTLLTRIEAILNSRPLCAVSNDPHDGPDYLSPGHFLIGAPLVAAPERPLADNISPHTRWQLLSQRAQQFWRTWSTEYLHSQMQRHKWTKGCADLSVGDVVFLFGVGSSPLQWPIGRVEEISPGRDGVTRVVTVRTARGSYVRPLNRLIKLPTIEV